MATHGLLLPTRAAVLGSETPTDLTARTRAEVVDLAQRAETLGFDSVWVGDSVLAKPRHEPLTTLAAVAAATDAVRLGTAVYLPPLRDPVHVAHQTATVDQLSGGRFVFGVGTGSAGTAGSSVETEYRELDVPWERRGALLDEQLDVITRLWTGDPVEYRGQFYDYGGASTGIRPCRTPPVFVGGTIHPTKGVLRAVRERVVARGDGWLPVAASPDSYALGLEQITDDLRAAGRDPERLEAAFYGDVLIADSEADALAEMRAFMRAYYPGMDPSDEELERRGVFGPPEKVEAQLARYAEAGVEHFVTRFPTTNQYEQLERFSRLL